jgi:hypothetical protein
MEEGVAEVTQVLKGCGYRVKLAPESRPDVRILEVSLPPKPRAARKPSSTPEPSSAPVLRTAYQVALGLAREKGLGPEHIELSPDGKVAIIRNKPIQQ